MRTFFMDMFVGWRAGTLGRVRLGIYIVILMMLLVSGLYFFLRNFDNLFALFYFMLTTVLNYYCGLLVMIKRYRELTRFPVIFALVHWGIAIAYSYTHLSALCALSLVLLLILLVAPGRRVERLAEPQEIA